MTAAHDAQAAAFPCIRGCTFPTAEDAPAKPKGARHGDLCDSCFYRLVAALKLVPDLVANMRANLWGIGAADYSERVGGGGAEAPAPLNLGPLDASDALFAKLASWIAVFAEEFGHAGLSIPTWANGREVQGSRPVSVEVATERAAQQVGWLADRLERICGTTSAAALHDDLCIGHEDARGVFSLSAAYGVKARPVPKADKRACPKCGAMELFVKTPNAFDDSLAVMCGRCGESQPEHKKAFREFMDAWEEATRKVDDAGEVDHQEAVGGSRRFDGQVLAGVALVATVVNRTAAREDIPVYVPERAAVRAEPRETSTAFLANYSGPCPGGCNGIEPGDEVAYFDDALMHTDCENAEGLRADYPERAEVVCTECWVIQPCGCGEF